MGLRTPEERERYRVYRKKVESERLGPALRNAILILFLLQTFVFIPADWLVFRDSFELFLSSRLALNGVLAVIYFLTALRYPVASSAAVCAAGGLLFITMVTQTGGSESGYYVGLILLVIGMGVLTPLTGKQALAIASMLFVSYAALPFYYTDAPMHWTQFWMHLFFLGAACIEAAWACAHMERMRYADHEQQRELLEARDRLAELDRAKSRFSANVHHELRTPLTLILAPLDALRSGELGELPSTVEGTLATMYSNGRRLYKMINNLLDLSKLESSQFGIHRRPMRLEPLVDELVTGARALAERKGVELRMEGFAALPEINADPDAIDKALVNLVGNALKFTDSGDSVCVSAEQQGEEIHISVADTGLGIPPSELGTIFDRFAQVDGSATRRHEGTGIGLSLAMEMIELHGGRIWAESEGEGYGATMRVVLPIGEPDELAAEDVLQDDSGELHGLGRSIEAIEADLQMEIESELDDSLVDVERSVRRWQDSCEGDGGDQPAAGPSADALEVLIAEDNPDMRALLAMLVSKEFRVRLARNGREALDSVHEAPPDLILSDVMMPEMSGLELCRAIKESEETRSIPVVLVTSKAEREMKIEGLELGADDYVSKPFHPRELMARVRSLIRVTGLQRQLADRNEELELTLRELKQAEVQLVQSERLAAVGELAAGIAHEVNNPVNFALNAVRAMEPTVKELREVAQVLKCLDASDPELLAEQVEALSRSNDDGDAAEAADTLMELAGIVSEGLKRTHSLVGDLRDFAAPGRHGEMNGGIDVEQGLRSTIQLLKHTLSSRNARIELEAEPGIPTVFGDVGGLNQVFLNLIKNAAESFDEDGGLIEIKLEREDDVVRVTVLDDGPGISEEVRKELFEPFFTTKDAGEGTGLGLSISRQIVDAHGGTLEVASEEGAGSRFTMTLPLTPPVAEEEPSAGC